MCSRPSVCPSSCAAMVTDMFTNAVFEYGIWPALLPRKPLTSSWTVVLWFRLPKSTSFENPPGEGVPKITVGGDV